MRRTGFVARGPRKPAVPDQVREDLHTRCKARCEVCNALTGHAFDPHHRKLQAQGGLDTLDNLLACCRRCHSWIHGLGAQAYDLGLLVKSWDDPGTHPVRLHRGLLVLLADGQMVPVDL